MVRLGRLVADDGGLDRVSPNLSGVRWRHAAKQPEAQICSGTIWIAPEGHSATQRPHPLQ